MSLQLIVLLISIVSTFVKAQPTATNYVPPESNDVFPYEEVDGTRFCFLDMNATCYCCTWIKYTDDLSLRAIGSIVGAAVTFLILMIFMCTCCWSTSLQDRLKVTRKDGPAAHCHFMIKFFIMGIPLLILVAGLLLLAVGWGGFNPLFNDGSAQVKIPLAIVESYRTPINDMIEVMPNGVYFNTKLLQDGLQDLEDNANV
jgi:hypothetical protein